MSDDTQATGQDAPVTTADTADTQTSEASETKTKQAPEATQEQAKVEETEAPETKATDTAEEKLLAGKYKSVEDLEKSYKELESKYGKEAGEKAELAKILNEAFLTPDPVQPSAQDQTSDTDEEFQEENPVNQDVENLKRITAVQTFIMTHDDANSEAMQKILQEDPLIQQISGHQAKLEYAYLRSQNMTKKSAIAEAEKKSAEQTQAKIVEKQGAQVESAKKAETSAEGKELMTKVVSGSPDEREEARRALIRKHLINL